MNNVFISSHPLVLASLTVLRNKETNVSLFRYHAERISQLLLAEASSDFSVSEKEIETPLQKTSGVVLADHIVLMTILRAGLSMLEVATKLFPDAPVGLTGLARDEKTATAHEYYWKMPQVSRESIIFLLDPMLATGGSLLHVLRNIPRAKQIRIVTIISAPEGISAVHEAFPDVSIYTAAVDQGLNAQKFIFPGLGDFGDRFFGTE